jgi:hypothetical protein
MTKIFHTILLLLTLVLTVSAREWKKGDPCPTEIHTLIPHEGWTDDIVFGEMSTVHDAMRICPNITSLRLRVAHLGCSSSPDRFDFPFDQGGHDKYPTPLEVLILDGYDFDRVERVSPGNWRWWIDHIKALKSWKWHSKPEEQPPKRNIDLWLDAMDFSRIHTLSLDKRDRSSVSDNVTELLPPRLTSLNNLTLAGSNSSDFFLRLPKNSLKSITWLGSNNISSFESVLHHHGNSLIHLDWHSDEALSRPRATLSVEHLRQLSNLAPNLESLAIYLDRNNSWPWDRLQILASELPSLTNLTVYLDIASDCRRQMKEDWELSTECDLSCPTKEQYRKPLLNRTTALEVAEFIKKHNAGKALQYITLRSGDWSPPWDGALYFPGWLEYKSAWAECGLYGGKDGSISCEGQDTSIRSSNPYCEAMFDKANNKTDTDSGLLLEQMPGDL